MVARFYWFDNTRVLNLDDFVENLTMVLHVVLHKNRSQANWSAPDTRQGTSPQYQNRYLDLVVWHSICQTQPNCETAMLSTRYLFPRPQAVSSDGGAVGWTCLVFSVHVRHKRLEIVLSHSFQSAFLSPCKFHKFCHRPDRAICAPGFIGRLGLKKNAEEWERRTLVPH